MASKNSSSSLDKNRKKHDIPTQSRVTSYFKPSPETSVSRRSDERPPNAVGVKKRFQEPQSRSVSNTLQVSPIKRSCEVVTSDSVSSGNKKKRVIQESPTKETIPVQKHEVIAIDVDSSDGAINSDVDAFPSPLKKKKIARVVKKPIESQTSISSRTSKVFDSSQRKGGLAMRSPNKSSVRDTIPTRVALEEKKNLNREKRSGDPDIETDTITCSPVKKLKRTHSIGSSQEDSVKDNEGQSKLKRCTIVLESMEIKIPSRKQAKDENKSNRKDIVAEKLNFAGKIDGLKRTKTATTRQSAEASTSIMLDSSSLKSSEKKQTALLDTVQKLNDVPKAKAVEYWTQPTVSIRQKNIEKEDSNSVGVTSSTLTKSQPTEDEESKTVQKACQRRIVRRSQLHAAEKNGLSITSKITVGLEEINAGAVVAFRQTYQDIETLLDLKLDVRICPDFNKALQIPKRVLPNSFHVNFNFFMKRKPVEHIEALRSQRIDCHRYSHAVDLHSVIYGILMVKQYLFKAYLLCLR